MAVECIVSSMSREIEWLAVLEDLVFSDSGTITNNGTDSFRLSPD